MKEIKGNWWYKGNNKLKFELNKCVVEKFDDLKKIFKFSKQNWELIVNEKKIKKLNYNFYIDNKRVTKKEIIKIIGG